MTPEQYDRWKDFALRMARTCYAKSRRPSAEWIVGVVEDFFDGIDRDDDWTTTLIESWDHSADHPTERQTWRSYCGCNGYRHEHGEPNRNCDECRGSGTHYDFFSGPLVCDMVMEHFDSYEPSSPECAACRQSRYDDDYDDSLECRCDEIEEKHHEQWQEQWGNPVRCCIRAGLDFASAPSAGVIGFTAGDVRRMYPEGVPDWVFPPGEQLHYWPSEELNGTFDELPDDAGVVL